MCVFHACEAVLCPFRVACRDPEAVHGIKVFVQEVFGRLVKSRSPALERSELRCAQVSGCYGDGFNPAQSAEFTVT